MFKRVVGIVVTAVGGVTVLVALFSLQLGIDREPDWGPARSFLLLTGIILLVLPHLKVIISRLIEIAGLVLGLRNTVDRTGNALDGERWRRSSLSLDFRQNVTEGQRVLWINLTCVVAWILLLVASLWFLSSGRWNLWPRTTDYYHLLADGFRAGKTHLLVPPPDQLLALEDPYDVQSREGLYYLWDVSLYNGKYYLYWGPTPALVTVVLELSTRQMLTDTSLVWFFGLGIAAVMLLVIRNLWIQEFQTLSWWTYIPVAIGAVFSNPLLWIMTRAAVYEVAISSGQFFFISGLASLVASRVNAKNRDLMLLLTGLCWSLAVGSRISLGPAVIVLSLSMLVVLFFEDRDKRPTRDCKCVSCLYLMIPLILGAAALFWYNFDRFGSTLELGHRFQLGRTNKVTDYSAVLMLRNIPQNIYNYLLNPPRLINVFPYIKPTWGDYSIPFLRYSASEHYHTEQVSGVLWAVPFALFAFVPVARWISRLWSNLDEIEPTRKVKVDPFQSPKLREMYIWWIMAFILVSIPLLFLSVNSMRHELDFIPTLFVSASIGYGHTIRSASSRIKYVLLTTAATIISLLTVLVSLLLAVTGYNGALESRNPELFLKLIEIFTW